MLSKPLHSVLGILILPTVLSGVVALTLGLLQRGVPAGAIVPVALLAVASALLILERLAPLHRAWNRRPEWLDVLLLLGNRLVDVVVIAGVLALLSALHASGIRMQLLSTWPTHWPLLAQAALGMIMAEAIRYLMHRLSHRPGFLGRVHDTHHAPQRMYTLNGPRLHPLNQLWISVANTVPMLAFGAQLPAVVLAATLTASFVLLQHANLGLRFVGWNLIFATPDVHRMHHLREASAKGANYGIVFLVFDHLFGTYLPERRITEATGIGPTARAGGRPEHQ